MHPFIVPGAREEERGAGRDECGCGAGVEEEFV